jgi:hypothetical protein
MEWINLTWSRVHGRVLVDTAINLRVQLQAGNFAKI